MKMKRKALAFLLTLCMLFVLIPAQPAAADESYGTLRALNERKLFMPWTTGMITRCPIC